MPGCGSAAGSLFVAAVLAVRERLDVDPDPAPVREEPARGRADDRVLEAMGPRYPGPTTRAALTVAMGLNRSTIGALTAELVGAGLVREEPPPRRAGAGRPSLVVVPEGERVYVLAVDLGVEHLAVARVGLGGRVLDRRELAYRRGAQDVGDVAATIARLAEELRAEACPGATCGVAGGDVR